MWVATQDLPRSAAHPFYRRLNRILDEAQFDAFVEGACATFYAAVMGRPLYDVTNEAINDYLGGLKLPDPLAGLRKGGKSRK